jgi:hypothetical protein
MGRRSSRRLPHLQVNRSVAFSASYGTRTRSNTWTVCRADPHTHKANVTTSCTSREPGWPGESNPRLDGHSVECFHYNTTTSERAECGGPRYESKTVINSPHSALGPAHSDLQKEKPRSPAGLRGQSSWDVWRAVSPGMRIGKPIVRVRAGQAVVGIQAG